MTSSTVTTGATDAERGQRGVVDRRVERAAAVADDTVTPRVPPVRVPDGRRHTTVGDDAARPPGVDARCAATTTPAGCARTPSSRPCRPSASARRARRRSVDPRSRGRSRPARGTAECERRCSATSGSPSRPGQMVKRLNTIAATAPIGPHPNSGRDPVEAAPPGRTVDLPAAGVGAVGVQEVVLQVDQQHRAGRRGPGRRRSPAWPAARPAGCPARRPRRSSPGGSTVVASSCSRIGRPAHPVTGSERATVQHPGLAPRSTDEQLAAPELCRGPSRRGDRAPAGRRRDAAP